MATAHEWRGLRAVSITLGIFLFGLGAALALFLLQTVFPAGLPAGTLPAYLSAFSGILFSAYGFSAFLIPCFLLYAAILLVIPGWTARAGFILAGSAIPFFTVVGGERIVRSLVETYAGSPIAAGILAGIAACTLFATIAEYVIILWLADRFSPPAGTGTRATRERILPEAEPFPATPRGTGRPASGLALSSLDDWPEHVSLDEGEEGAEGHDIGENDYVMDLDAETPAATGVLVAEETPEPAVRAGTDSLGTTESGFFQAAPERLPPSTRPEDATPTYVDFERMKAPFDLPVVDDWVETETDGAEPREISGESPVEVDPAPVADEFPDPVEAAEFSDDPSPDPFEDDPPEAMAASPAVPHGRPVDDHPFEVSFADLADYGDSPEFEVLDDEAAAEAATEIGFDAEDGDIYEDEDEDGEETLDEEDFEGIDEEEDTLGEMDGDGTKDLPESIDLPVTAPKARRGRRHYDVPYDILNTYPDGEYWIIDDATRRAASALKETLNEFRIQADVTGIRKGPVITMFEILPAPGVKLSKIVGLQDNIALRLAASSVRIVAPIPGKHAVGIEVPNQRRSLVSFRELIETDTPAAKKMEIPVILGKDITGEAQLLDLATTPHLLIAGSTGAGKSVCVNSIILSILYKRSPDEVRLLLIDPKIVELKLYNDIGHLLAPVITEPKKAFQSLQYCLCEMERRYALLDGMGVRDIKSYNRRIVERNIATEKLPYLVVIIDEFADLMATTGKELESTVARLCAMSRAVGIHLVLATQRPSIDVITGLIKANIPSRIAFMVASKMDSRIIIDQVGAEKLLGRGDMLYASATDPFPTRIQGAFVSEEEVERVVEHVKTLGEPEYIDEEIFVDDEEDEDLEPSLFSDGEDPLYDKALEIVLNAGKASASYIQRKLKIGYNRAARLVEDMEARGIVGPANGSKPREVVHRP